MGYVVSAIIQKHFQKRKKKRLIITVERLSADCKKVVLEHIRTQVFRSIIIITFVNKTCRDARARMEDSNICQIM